MAITKMFCWWYAHGWAIFVKKNRLFLTDVIDFFSMSSLLRTLFKPFRQISASSANSGASLDLKFHMFIDRLISRVIGFFSRLILLVIGSIVIIFDSLLCLTLVILWPIVPLIPVTGLVLTFFGVTI